MASRSALAVKHGIAAASIESNMARIAKSLDFEVPAPIAKSKDLASKQANDVTRVAEFLSAAAGKIDPDGESAEPVNQVTPEPSEVEPVEEPHPDDDTDTVPGTGKPLSYFADKSDDEILDDPNVAVGAKRLKTIKKMLKRK